MNEEFEGHRRGNNTQERITRFENMLKKDEVYFFDVEEFEDMIDYYLDENELEKAQQVIHIAHQQHPDSVSFLISESHVKASMGKLIVALEILDLAGSIEPANDEIYLIRASIHSQLRNYKEAINNYTEALKYTSENLDEIYLDLAFEYENFEDLKNAEKCIKQALEFNPENEAALYEMAYCYELSNNFEGGINFYKKFIDLNPYSFTAWYNLGNTYNKTRQYSNALDAYDFCIAIKENFSSAHFNKANVYFKLKEYELAIESYNEALRYESDRASTFYYLGECHEKLGQYSFAEEKYRKAIELDENYADAWLGIGILKDIQGQLAKGIKFIEKAADLMQDSASYISILAHAYHKLGRNEDAMFNYQQAIKLNAKSESTWLSCVELTVEEKGYDEGISLLNEGLKHVKKHAELLYRKAALLFLSHQNKEGLIILEEALTSSPEKVDDFLAYSELFSRNNQIIALIELYKK